MKGWQNCVRERWTETSEMVWKLRLRGRTYSAARAAITRGTPAGRARTISVHIGDWYLSERFGSVWFG